MNARAEAVEAKVASPLYLWLICLVAALGGLLFGYDWVVIGGAKLFYETYFSVRDPVMSGWLMSSALIGCIGGAMVAGMLAILAVTYAAMLVAIPIQRLLGLTGLAVVSRVVGVLLAALAIQFLIDGIKTSGVLG